MKKITLIIVAISLIIFSSSYCQEVYFLSGAADEKKTGIDKDIEVAENILLTLIQQETGLKWIGGVKGDYIKGYGVIFSFPKSVYDHRITTGYSGRRSFTISSGEGIILDDDASARSALRKLGVAADSDVDSLIEANHKQMVEVAKTFIADYGGLIKGLKEEEKIMITDSPSGFSEWRVFPTGHNDSGKMVIEAKVSDVNQYKVRKISKAQLIERIEVNLGNNNVKVAKDLELLSSIFNRLYQADLSETYYLSGKMQVNYLKEFGAVYSMRVYSSTETRRGRHRIHTLGVNDLSDEERDKKVKELYPIFKDELIENIIQYGATINSLEDDEFVMFKVRLTKCDECEIPDELKVTLKYSLLQKFKEGKIGMGEAINKVNVEEVGKQ